VDDTYLVTTGTCHQDQLATTGRSDSYLVPLGGNPATGRKVETQLIAMKIVSIQCVMNAQVRWLALQEIALVEAHRTFVANRIGKTFITVVTTHEGDAFV
jgi:hypothetical protein